MWQATRKRDLLAVADNHPKYVLMTDDFAGGNYLALAITDIPLDTGATYTFTLTPYVAYNSGETVFSDEAHKITISFTDYKMNIAYEKAE